MNYVKSIYFRTSEHHSGKKYVEVWESQESGQMIMLGWFYVGALQMSHAFGCYLPLSEGQPNSQREADSLLSMYSLNGDNEVDHQQTETKTEDLDSVMQQYIAERKLSRHCLNKLEYTAAHKELPDEFTLEFLLRLNLKTLLSYYDFLEEQIASIDISIRDSWGELHPVWLVKANVQALKDNLVERDLVKKVIKFQLKYDPAEVDNLGRELIKRKYTFIKDEDLNYFSLHQQ